MSMVASSGLFYRAIAIKPGRSKDGTKKRAAFASDSVPVECRMKFNEDVRSPLFLPLSLSVRCVMKTSMTSPGKGRIQLAATCSPASLTAPSGQLGVSIK